MRRSGPIQIRGWLFAALAAAVLAVSAAPASAEPPIKPCPVPVSQNLIAAVSHWFGCSPATTTSLTASPNPAATGQQVTYTAAVKPAPNGGTVAFTDDGASITGCGAVSISASTGQATCQASYSTPATHTIQARYTGDDDFKPSFSGQLQESVTAPPTGTQPPPTSPTPPTPPGSSGGGTLVDLSGKPVVSGDRVSIKLGCSASATGDCEVTLKLTVTEITRGGRVVAVASRAKRKRHSVVVGATKASLAPGQTKKVTVSLAPIGLKLLQHYHAVHPTLTVNVNQNGHSVKVASRKTTIKAKRKTRKKHAS